MLRLYILKNVVIAECSTRWVTRVLTYTYRTLNTRWSGYGIIFAVPAKILLCRRGSLMTHMPRSSTRFRCTADTMIRRIVYIRRRCTWGAGSTRGPFCFI